MNQDHFTISTYIPFDKYSSNWFFHLYTRISKCEEPPYHAFPSSAVSGEDHFRSNPMPLWLEINHTMSLITCN